MRTIQKQLVQAARGAKDLCATRAQAECLHADALGESIAQLDSALRVLSIGTARSSLRRDVSQTFVGNARLIDSAGFTVKFTGECWYNGGAPCLRISDAMQGRGMKAVGASWGAYLVLRVLDGEIAGINLPA